MFEIHKRSHVCVFLFFFAFFLQIPVQNRQCVNFHFLKAVISLTIHLFLENDRVGYAQSDRCDISRNYPRFFNGNTPPDRKQESPMLKRTQLKFRLLHKFHNFEKEKTSSHLLLPPLLLAQLVSLCLQGSTEQPTWAALFVIDLIWEIYLCCNIVISSGIWSLKTNTQRNYGFPILLGGIHTNIWTATNKHLKSAICKPVLSARLSAL